MYKNSARIPITLVLFLIGVFSVGAQNSKRTLVFILRDADTGDPIKYARLKCIGANGFSEDVAIDTSGILTYKINADEKFTFSFSDSEHLNSQKFKSDQIRSDTVVVAMQYIRVCNLTFPYIVFPDNSSNWEKSDNYLVLTEDFFNPKATITIYVGLGVGESTKLGKQRAKEVTRRLISKGIPKEKILVEIQTDNYPVFAFQESYTINNQKIVFRKGQVITAAFYQNASQELKEILNRKMRTTHVVFTYAE